MCEFNIGAMRREAIEAIELVLEALRCGEEVGLDAAERERLQRELWSAVNNVVEVEKAIREGRPEPLGGSGKAG